LVDVRLAKKQIEIRVNKQKQFSNYKIYTSVKQSDVTKEIGT